MQDAYVVVLTAIDEHDPNRGQLSTCVAKVARRFLMRKRREQNKRALQHHAGKVHEYERTSEAGGEAAYPYKSEQYVKEKAGELWK